MVDVDCAETEVNGAASVNSNHPSSVKHIKMVLNADSSIT